MNSKCPVLKPTLEINAFLNHTYLNFHQQFWVLVDLVLEDHRVRKKEDTVPSFQYKKSDE